EVFGRTDSAADDEEVDGNVLRREQTGRPHELLPTLLSAHEAGISDDDTVERSADLDPRLRLAQHRRGAFCAVRDDGDGELQVEAASDVAVDRDRRIAPACHEAPNDRAARIAALTGERGTEMPHRAGAERVGDVCRRKERRIV